MHYSLNMRKVLVSLGLTALFNTVIALFLTYLGFGQDFPVNFLFSQCIGLSICAFILGGHLLLKHPSLLGHSVLLLVAMPVGATAGMWLGALIAGISFRETLQGTPGLFLQMLFVGILFGTIITYFFFSREKISQTEAQLQQEQIKRLTLEKETIETRLRLLQAQIEPHFLFNTLSTIISLLESDPDKGRAMLEDLTRYLRASLSRTRNSTTTLGQELDLVRAYLDICKIRMGERLQYCLQIPESLKGETFPPMLLQPLVENAVKHGLEPSLKGGEILIRAEKDPERLRVAVTDTGNGLSEKAIAGVGLSNVRQRLEALFSNRGRLILEEHQPSELKAILEIDHE